MTDAFVVQDIDREGLVEHFAVESEAKSLREWVAKSDCPRPEGFEPRIRLANKRREEGNKAFAKSEWALAVWLYLASLQAIDYSKKDRVNDGIEESPDKARRWQEAVMTVLSNMAAAFGAKDDNYNAIRAADLGLAFADKLITVKDGRDTFRAKLLYRRGLARARSEGGGEATLAAEDVAAAVKLDGGNNPAMRATLKRLKLAAKGEKIAFEEMRGALNPREERHAEEEKRQRSGADETARENEIQKQKEPNLAEIRAHRRKLSTRLSRFCKRVATKIPKGERIVRTAVLGLTAVAVWLAMPDKEQREKGVDLPGNSSSKFRLVVAALVLARVIEVAVRTRGTSAHTKSALLST